MLDTIIKHDLATQKVLFDDLGWGFLNNNKNITANNYRAKFLNKSLEVTQLYKQPKYRQAIDQMLFTGFKKYFNSLLSG